MSQTKALRLLISRCLTSPLHFGQLTAPKILYFSPDRFFEESWASTVTIALLLTPIARRYAASVQMQSKASLKLPCQVFQDELPGAIRFPCDRCFQFQP